MTTDDISARFSSENWYADAKKYWENVDSTVDGMLGGLQELDPIDVKGSREFLDKLFIEHGTPLHDGRPLKACGNFHYSWILNSRLIDIVKDCGAGIGRVTKNFLQHSFDEVELVEANADFLRQAPSYIGRQVKTINCGLEDFSPATGDYHVIWCQWVLSHLTDDHLIAFVKRCLESVESVQGYLIIKENISRSDDYIVDEDDSSVTRSAPVWRALFERSGAAIVMEQLQPDFPQHLFPVTMWALRVKRT